MNELSQEPPMIEVHYFASIRESLGVAREQLDTSPDITTVAALLDKLVELHGDTWDRVLRQGRVLMAVNKTVARPDTAVRPGDEVAFFPPVTGG
jgi:molybdopterin synthase sulfur carrier subunit